MNGADLQNAHIRRRVKPEQERATAADDSQRLLNDPAFIRGHALLRDELIRTIEDGKDDGTEQFEELMLETCRTLRTLKALRRTLGLSVQTAQLSEAGFKPHSPEKED